MELTSKQISAIRAALLSIHQADYSYPAIGTLIDEYTESLTPTVDYRISDKMNFDNSKKLEGNDNFRKFIVADSQTMSDDYLLRIVLWLTSDECDQSSLTWEELFGEPALPKIAGLLANFLYRTTDTLAITNLSSLIGNYHSQPSTDQTGEWSLSLSIPRVIIANTLQAQAVNTLSNTDDQDKFIHKGFLTIASEDNGLMLTECQEEQSNSIWNLIGIIKDYNDEKVRALAMWLNPSALLSSHPKSLNREKLLEAWLEKEPDNLLILNRKDDFS